MTYLAKLTDRNESTFYVAEDGTLTRDRDAAERFFTARMADLVADPAANGIPASRIAALDIVGAAEAA